jgi:ribonuclease BN (tRNA processing enzyme)
MAASARVRVRFLGTGGAANECRRQASLLVEPLAGEGGPLLLDTGNGLDTVRQLLALGQDPSRVRDIFISHRHIDHLGGLEPTLLWSAIQSLRRSGQRPTEQTRVYAEPGVIAAIQQLFQAIATVVPKLYGEQLVWVPLHDGAPVELPNGGRLTPFLVEHIPPDAGAMGCLVELDGVRLGYSGDTRPVRRLLDICTGVPTLFHEAGGLDSDADFIHIQGHSTAGDAGRVARAAGVQRLILTHLPDDGLASAMLAEASAAFGGPVELATDHEMVEL